MRIAEAELIEIAIPLQEPFIISGGAITERRSLIVVLRDGEGHEGYGECPAFDLPFYSEETLGTARHVLATVLLPRVWETEFEGPAAVDAALRQNVRGNAFARAAVETAAWDLAAARSSSSMARLLAASLDVAPASAIACGVALGIPQERSLDALAARVLQSLDLGYRRVKIKVMPGWDLEPVRRVQSVLSGTGIPLTVDANGAYAWPEHERALRELDQFGLLYIEQPLAPEELVGHAELSRVLVTPVCVDETLTSAGVARQLLSLGGSLVWNIKVHRVGGLSEVARIWRLARDGGAILWAGTMPETGIGSQAPLAAAALPGFDYPSDLEPSARWFGRNSDVIKLAMRKDGMMNVPGVSISHLLDRKRFMAASSAA
jgi:O-succinylbenzoate synthase